MPQRKASKAAQTDKILERYSEGTLPLSKEHLRSIITAIPDADLKDAEKMAVYIQRINWARRGILPKGSQLSFEEVGKLLGISGAAVFKKEHSNAPIDRNDLLMFCLLYRVSPHYLLGMVPGPYDLIMEPTVLEDLIGNRIGNKEKGSSRLATIPMAFPPAQVQGRAQLIIYNAYNSDDLYSELFQLSAKGFRIQQRVIARFQDLPVFEDCPIDEMVKQTFSDEFQMEWTRFIVFKSEKEQAHIRKFMERLARLGTRNFACLDTMARVSISSQSIKNAVAVLIKEDLKLKAT